MSAATDSTTRPQPPPLAKQRRHRFQKLEALDCWPELRQRIQMGQSIPQLAEWATNVLKEWPGSLNSLQVSLYEWRRANPPTPDGRSMPTVPNRAPTGPGPGPGPGPEQAKTSAEDRVNGQEKLRQMLERVERSMQEDLDEFEELGRLYRMQQERIKEAIVSESEIGFMNPQVGVLMGGAVKLLERRGIMRRQLGTNKAKAELEAEKLQAEARTRLTGTGRVLEDPVSRGKVLSLVKRLTKFQATADEDDVAELLGGSIEADDESEPAAQG